MGNVVWVYEHNKIPQLWDRGYQPFQQRFTSLHFLSLSIFFSKQETSGGNVRPMLVSQRGRIRDRRGQIKLLRKIVLLCCALLTFTLPTLKSERFEGGKRTKRREHKTKNEVQAKRHEAKLTSLAFGHVRFHITDVQTQSAKRETADDIHIRKKTHHSHQKHRQVKQASLHLSALSPPTSMITSTSAIWLAIKPS